MVKVLIWRGAIHSDLFPLRLSTAKIRAPTGLIRSQSTRSDSFQHRRQKLQCDRLIEAQGAMAGGPSVSLFHIGDDFVEFWRLLVHLTILVVFVIVFEQLLHALEHHVNRYPKYEEILRKVYRELMILGFIGLGLKIVKETDVNVIAFQAADLNIFIMALTLILQAICIFLRLRRKDNIADRAELISTPDLADAWHASNVCGRDHATETPLPTVASSRALALLSRSRAKCEEMVQIRVLRQLFLRRTGLPHLFPFAKYLRQAHDNQVTHMIDVQMSTWFLLLAMAWSMNETMWAIEKTSSDNEQNALIISFLIFAYALVGLHVIVALYFKHCVRQLLKAGGYASNLDTHNCLQTIAQEEAEALSLEAADDALGRMQTVQEKLEAEHMKHKYHYHHLLQRDIGLQLICNCLRKIKHSGRSKRDGSHERMSTDSDASSKPDMAMPDNVHIRSFSRKAWHFFVIAMLMMNGFLFALLCQCILYRLDDVYRKFSLVVVLLIPLPMLLNTIVLQPIIFRNFMLVSSIFRVDVSTLTDVVTHFSEIVELRSDFARSLNETMKQQGKSSADLEMELQARDPKRTGMIEAERLRLVLRKLGFNLSYYRFNSVVKLMFRLKGTNIEYAQVTRLLLLSQTDEFALVHLPVHHLLLRRSVKNSSKDEDEALLAEEQDPVGPTTRPPLEPSVLRRANTRRGLLQRQPSQFAGTSSRALQQLYHIDSAEFDLSSDKPDLVTHFVRM